VDQVFNTWTFYAEHLSKLSGEGCQEERLKNEVERILPLEQQLASCLQCSELQSCEVSWSCSIWCRPDFLTFCSVPCPTGIL
jgi:hypothetical protein